MTSTVTKEQRENMFNLMKAERVANSTPKSKHEIEIWRKAFDLYNFGTGSKLNDLTCQRCCNEVLNWLQE